MALIMKIEKTITITVSGKDAEMLNHLLCATQLMLEDCCRSGRLDHLVLARSGINDIAEARTHYEFVQRLRDQM